MKKNLLKTMLVAIGMAIGGGNGAWAQETNTLYERGTSGNEWTEENLSDFFSADKSLTLSDYGAYFTGSGNISHEFSKSINASENSVINVDAYWYGMSNVGRRFDQGNGTYFRFGNVFVTQNDQDQKHGYGLNGIDNMNTVTIFKGTNTYRNYDISAKKFLHIEMEINTATNTLNYLKISEDGADNYLVDIENQPLENVEYNTIAVGHRRAGRVSTDCFEYLKSIKITETKQTVQSLDYKFVYKYNDEVVLEESGTNVVGASVMGKSVVMSEAGEKYLVIADEIPTITISAGAENTLVVPVRKPYTATLSLTYNVNGTETTKYRDLVETDDKVATWIAGYPMYMENNGLYYKSETETPAETGTFTNGEVINKTVNYNISEEDVVYYEEAENLPNTGASINTDCYNAGFAHINGSRKAELTTLTSGKYSCTIVNLPDGNGTYRDIFFRDCGISDNTTNELFHISKTERGEQTKEFYVTADTEIGVSGYTTVSGGLNQSGEIDYILIKRVGDATETVSVGESGLSTYCPTVDLDFSASLNINAYAAKINGDVVELTKVNTVKAGEGILLSTEGQGAQTEEIAIASATEDNANDFIGVIEAMVLPEAADGDVNYVLSKKDGVVGFFRANNTNIAAGKAYLKVPAEAAAKGLKMVFGDTTGISEVAAPAKNDGAFYTLSGVRVESPVKGVYIHNGKKVVVK